jgi:DNA-binding HxlR family transcriptional regulator
MTTGFPDTQAQATQAEDECLSGASIADVLRILSAGATGAILMTLGEGPLRTKELTDRVPGYAPRTIYRYAGKLAALEVIDREEGPGVPSKVVHSLSDPCGTELYGLVNRFADASLTRLPDGRIDAHAWASLGLLADLWEAGMVEELSCEARSPTELARGPHGLSYHQVNRRAGLFKTAGLLREWPGEGRRRCYALTERTRRTMGLIAGIGRWRDRHVVTEEEVGMAAAEAATALRAALPLVRLPQHADKRLQLCVEDEEQPPGRSGERVWAEVAADGAVDSCGNPGASVDASGQGETAAWISMLLDGDPQRLQIEGDEGLAGHALTGLYEVLWTPTPL